MELRVPGDKSITQRALILASLAEGESRLRGLLPGADPAATAGALRALGAEIPELPDDGSEIRVRGTGLRGFRGTEAPLDLANSGTGARLLLGVLAGQPVDAVVTGDASLRGRPMRRVTEPLEAMGARFEELGEPDRLPLRVRGGELGPLEWETPVASAQVKSALLLAGLTAGVFVLVAEPARSRDHTERMLELCGASTIGHWRDSRWRVELRDPPDHLRPLDFRVPGDFSSAAYFLALGLLGGAGPELVVRDVGLNPTRTGLLPVLERMGADPEVVSGDVEGEGEPSGDLRVQPTRLRGTELGGREVVGLIDEVPLVAVLGARAEGTTRITDAEELRVKETDRIRAVVENLRTLGVAVEELEDGLVVEGTDAPLRGRIRAYEDHRIAMAFGILGAAPGNEIEVDDRRVVDVSFPGFWQLLERIAGSGAGPGLASGDPGGRSDERDSRDRTGIRDPEGLVVTIDGPAGSGKSSTARVVARRLGLRHLDSGALYRALTYALLDREVPPERWSGLSADELRDLPLEIRPTDTGFEVLYEGRVLEEELRSEEVTTHVSQAASHPAVRERLFDLQRRAARCGSVVADGRDMGTVVFPDADLKVYLTADLRERARRRLVERTGDEPKESRIEVEAGRIRERDRRDMERSTSPLRRPNDAVVLDTTELSFQEQVGAVVDRIRALTRP